MKLISSNLFPEVIKICPDVYKDYRGSFSELYSINSFPMDTTFVQDNISYSKEGVVRGLHFQLPPFEQGKLVTCLSGFVRDFVVDLRTTSPTFGRWDWFMLDGDFKEQVWIPAGFAHGFTTPAGSAMIMYKVTSVYNKASERTLLWNDPAVKILWNAKKDFSPIISEKDAQGKRLKELIYEL